MNEFCVIKNLVVNLVSVELEQGLANTHLISHLQIFAPWYCVGVFNK